MKKYITLVLLLVASQAFSQKKGKVDPKDLQLQIDTLTKTNSMLSTQLDSVSKEREKYYGVYTSVKDKVIKYDFDPAKMSTLIDSIRASRDSATSGLTTMSTSLQDSLSVMKKENGQLRATVDSLSSGDAVKAKLIGELKQLKELLDTKIITQAEFDAKKKTLMEKWN